jgi:hypothetical protein
MNFELFIAILSLLVAVAQWIWPQPRIPRQTPWILACVALFFFGVYLAPSLKLPWGNKIPIESIAHRVYAFESSLDDEINVDRTMLNATLKIENDEESHIGYIFDSSIPDSNGNDDYTGLAFRFVNSQDFTVFQDMIIEFSAPESLDDLDVHLLDINGNRGFVLELTSPDAPDSISREIEGQEYTVIIPIAENFQDVFQTAPPDKRAITEIVFTTGSSGFHTLVIRDVEFVR